MNATQFIQQHGVEKAREVVEGAPESATLAFYHFDEVNNELLGPEYYRDNGSQHFDKELKSWGFCLDPQVRVTEPHDGLVSVEDLKRIVESVEIIDRWKGLKNCKDIISSGTSIHQPPVQSFAARMIKAIADYEAIYGGEHV